MIETWLNQHDFCPLCKQSPCNFYTRKQKCVVWIKSVGKTFRKYGPFASNMIVHTLSLYVAYQRTVLLKESQNQDIVLPPLS